jgi:hypothetical protein
MVAVAARFMRRLTVNFCCAREHDFSKRRPAQRPEVPGFVGDYGAVPLPRLA